MAAFNLTAQINLRGPANISQVVSGIRRQLGTIQTTVRFTLDPNAARRTTALNQSLIQLNATLANTTTTARSAADALTLLTRASATSGGGATSSRNTQGAAAATRTLGDNARRTSQDLGVARTEMEEFGRQGALAIKRFAAFSVVSGAIFAVTGAIRAGLVEFVAYDKLMVKLKQVTGESAANLNKLSQTIGTLSTGLGVSSLELAGVSATLAQAGLSAKDAERSLRALALSSLAPSFDNMNQTVEGSIALMKQFSISAADLESSLGSINAVAARFAVEASDLISAIQRTGGVFASASKGVSEGKDALNEFISVFTSVRATTRESAESIATGLRTIFTRIQRGSTIEALKEFGVTLTDAEGKFVGAYKAVQLLSEGLSRLDPRDLKFGQIVEELGGFRQIGKVIPLIQQFAVAQQALKVAQEGGGSLADDAVTAQMALGNQLMKVREQFMSLIRSIGSSDAFQALAKTALGFASSILKVADALKGLLPALMILGAGKAAKGLVQFGAGFIGGLRRGAVPGQSMSTTAGDRLGGALSGAGPSGAGSPRPQRPSPDMIANTQAIRASGIVTGGLIVSVNRASDMLVAQIAATQHNSASLEASTQAIQSLIQAINTSSLGGPPLTANAGGAIVRRFARGGFVPGSGSGDTVPAMLEPGEFVIRKKAVDTLGASNLHKMNKSSGGNIRVGGYSGGGAVQKFAQGGPFRIDKLAENQKTAVAQGKQKLGNNRRPLLEDDDTASANIIDIDMETAPDPLTGPEKNFIRGKTQDISPQLLQYIKTKEGRTELVRAKKSKSATPEMKEFGTQYGGIEKKWGEAYEQVIKRRHLLVQGSDDKKHPIDIFNPLTDEKNTGVDVLNGDIGNWGEIKFKSDRVTDHVLVGKLLAKRIDENKVGQYFEESLPNTQDEDMKLGNLEYYSGLGGRGKTKTSHKQEFYDSLNMGGKVQKFMAGGIVAQRKVGYIDTDVLRDPVNQEVVGPAMKGLKITDVNAYKTYLSKLAVSSRKEGSLSKLRTIAGMPGAGKSSLMLGGSQSAVSDNAKLRRTTRFPILKPEDIRSASEVIDTTATVTPDKLDDYLKAADKIYMLSTSTKEEQKELKRRRGSRDTTGVNLFGRKPGSTSGAETDSGPLEAMLGSDIDASKLRTLGISSDYKLKRKKNIEVEKKKIALLHGSLSPTTVGHESLRTAAKAMGMPIEDFLVLISNDEGITSSDSHSLRTAVFDQDFRVLAARAAFKGSMVSKQTNKGFTLPDVMEISQGASGQRRFVRPTKGSLGMMVAGENKDIKKYTDKDYKPVQIPRTGGVSGTMARESILSGNLEEMKKILSPDVFSLVSQYLPQLKNRSSILPRIVEHSQKRQAYSLADITKELADFPQRIDSKKVASDPEYAAMAAQVKELRNRRDKINSRASFEPFSILRSLAKRYPETYGLQTDTTLSQAVKESVLAQGIVTAKTRPTNPGGPENPQTTAGAKPKTGLPATAAQISNMLQGSKMPEDSKLGEFSGEPITDDMVRRTWRAGYDGSMSSDKAASYGAVRDYFLQKFNTNKKMQAAKLAKRIRKSTKVGLVGLLPFDHSDDRPPIDIKGTDVTMYERGLDSQFAPQVEAMQAYQTAGVNKFATDIQMQATTGGLSSGQKMVYDFDQTLVTGADLFDSKGNIDIPGYSDLDRVEKALQGGTLTPLGVNLKQKLDTYPELLQNLRISTARPPNNRGLISSRLAELGLNIPADKITGMDGADKSKNLAENEIIVDDNIKTIERVRKAGKKGIEYAPIKSGLSDKESMATGQANIEGAVIEQAMAVFGAPIIEGARATRAIDYPNGLGAAASYFPGIGRDWPTEVKRTIDSDSRSQAIDEFTRYLFPEEPVTAAKKMAMGGKAPAKFGIGGLVPESVFGTGAMSFPASVTEQYTSEQMKTIQRALTDPNTMQNERVMVDDQAVQDQFNQKPLDKSAFISSFTKQISRDSLFSDMANFAKAIGIPGESLTSILPQLIDFQAPSPEDPNAFFDREAMGSFGVDATELAKFGWTKQNEQDLYGYRILAKDNSDKLLQTISSSSHDPKVAAELWDKEASLGLKLGEIRDLRIEAAFAARKVKQSKVKETGRGALSFSTSETGPALPNSVLYHELTHQVFNSLRTKVPESFDKYKTKVSGLFEGDNDDIANAVDALPGINYNSADMAYGRQYKVNSLFYSMKPLYGSSDAKEKETFEAMSKVRQKGIDLKQARTFKPFNPEMNQALLDSKVDPATISRMEDSGKEEFLTTLVQNIPNLDNNLNLILESTLTDLLGSAGISRQKFGIGGKASAGQRLGQEAYGLIEKSGLKSETNNILQYANSAGYNLEEFKKYLAKRVEYTKSKAGIKTDPKALAASLKTPLFKTSTPAQLALAEKLKGPSDAAYTPTPSPAENMALINKITDTKPKVSINDPNWIKSGRRFAGTSLDAEESKFRMAAQAAYSRMSNLTVPEQQKHMDNLAAFYKRNPSPPQKLAGGGAVDVFHGSNSGADDSVIENFKKNGVQNDIAQGYGQGAGFYVWSDIASAKNHATNIVKSVGPDAEANPMVTGAETTGSKMVVTLKEILDPNTWDLDYETNKSKIVSWIAANADKLKPLLAEEKGQVSLNNWNDTMVQAQDETGSRKWMKTTGPSDLRQGELIGKLMNRLQAKDPSIMHPFEEEFFSSMSPGTAIKYVGSNRLIPSNIEKFANGGAASDTVPALLTPGEFVINKKAAQSIGYSKLNKMNHADKIQGFASGGAVGGVQRFVAGGDAAAIARFADVGSRDMVSTRALESQLSALTRAMGTATAEQRRNIERTTPVAAVAAAVNRAAADPTDPIAAAAAAVALAQFRTELQNVANIAPSVNFQDILDINTGPIEATVAGVTASFGNLSQLMERLHQSGQSANSAFDEVNAAYEHAALVMGDTGATAAESAAALERVRTALQGVSEEAITASAPPPPPPDRDAARRARRENLQAGLGYASMAVGIAGQATSNMFDDRTRSGAQAKATTQAATNTASTGIALASQVSQIPGAGPALAGIVLLGTAAAAAGNALIAAHNSVIEFDKAMLQTKIGDAMDKVARDFENLSKDIHNADILKTLQASLQEASQDLSAMMDQQRTQTKAAWGNMLAGDMSGGGAQQAKRGEVLDLGGLGRYLAVMSQSSEVNQGSGRSARDEASNTFMSTQGKQIKEKSKDQAASFKPVAEGILQSFNAQMKGIKGTDQEDIFKQLKRADGTASEFANTIARANPLVNQQILQIENSNSINEADKKSKIDAVIAQEALYQTTLSTNAAMKQLSMDKLENKTRGFVNSFTRSLNNMDRALNITTFGLDKLSRQSELSSAALSGDAKAGAMKLDSVNVIQNTRGYTKSEGSSAQSQAASFFGSQAKTMNSMLKVSSTMEDTILSSINNTIKKDPKATDEKIGAQLRTSISGALMGLELPADLSDKLAKQTQDAVTTMRKEGNDTIDFGQLVEQIPALGKTLNVAREAQEMAIKALEAWQNNLNDYAEAMNQNVSIQMDMNSRLRKASDIRGQGKMELKKTFGREAIPLDEQVKLARQSTKTQTGGLTNPADIAMKVGKLENLRQAQQGMSDKAANRGLGGKDEFKMMQDRLKNTNTALRENYDALKNMAENTDQASLAMSRINEIQQKQQAGVGIAERMVTSNPQELSDLNNAMNRLSNNMRGNTNGSTTSDQRKQSLDAFNMIAPYLGEKQSGLKANVLESMMKESGQGVNPMMADVINSLRNPEADPEMAAAVQTYKEGNDLQALANTSLAEISQRMADNTADIAAEKLSKAMTGVKMSFESQTLSDINKNILTLVAQGNQEPGKNALGKAAGGVVYAAMGQKINFTPKGTDTVPAMLTPGEFVVNRSATQQHLPLLRQINSTGLQAGGSVNYLARGGIALATPFAKRDEVFDLDTGGATRGYGKTKTTEKGYENMLAFKEGAGKPITSPMQRVLMPRFAAASAATQITSGLLYSPDTTTIPTQNTKLGASYDSLTIGANHGAFNTAAGVTDAVPTQKHLMKPQQSEQWPTGASIRDAFQLAGDAFTKGNLPKKERLTYLAKLKAWRAATPKQDSVALKEAKKPNTNPNEQITPRLAYDAAADTYVLSNLTLPADEKHSILTRDWSKMVDEGKEVAQNTLGFFQDYSTTAIALSAGLYGARYGTRVVSAESQMKHEWSSGFGSTSGKIHGLTISPPENDSGPIGLDANMLMNLSEELDLAQTQLSAGKGGTKTKESEADRTRKSHIRALSELYDGTRYSALFNDDVIDLGVDPPLTIYSPKISDETWEGLMKTATQSDEGTFSTKNTKLQIVGIEENNKRTAKLANWTNRLFGDENIFLGDQGAFEKNDDNKNTSSTPQVYGSTGGRYHFTYKDVRARLYDAIGQRYFTEDPKQDFIAVEAQDKQATEDTNPFSALLPEQVIYAKDIESLIKTLNLNTPDIGQKAAKSRNPSDMYKYNLDAITKSPIEPEDPNSYVGENGQKIMSRKININAKEYGIAREKAMDKRGLLEAKAGVEKGRSQPAPGPVDKKDRLNSAKRVTLARELHRIARDPSLGNIRLRSRMPTTIQDITYTAQELGAGMSGGDPNNQIWQKLDAFRAFFVSLQDTNSKTSGNTAGMLINAGLVLNDDMFKDPVKINDPRGIPPGTPKNLYFKTHPFGGLQPQIMSIIKNQMMGTAAAKSVSTMNEEQQNELALTGGKFRKSKYGQDPAAKEDDIPSNFLDLYNRSFDPQSVYPDATSRTDKDMELMMQYWKHSKNADGSLTFAPKLSAMMNSQTRGLQPWYKLQDATENTGLKNDEQKDKETDADYQARIAGTALGVSYQKNLATLQIPIASKAWDMARVVAQKFHEVLGSNAHFGPLPKAEDMKQRLMVEIGDDTAKKKKEKEAQEMKELARGGVVYASSGKLINYQPRGTDTVPAMLTPGEFVVNRAATQKNLPLLKSINGGAQGYENGGVAYLEGGGGVANVFKAAKKVIGVGDKANKIIKAEDILTTLTAATSLSEAVLTPLLDAGSLLSKPALRFLAERLPQLNLFNNATSLVQRLADLANGSSEKNDKGTLEQAAGIGLEGANITNSIAGVVASIMKIKGDEVGAKFIGGIAGKGLPFLTMLNGAFDGYNDAKAKDMKMDPVTRSLLGALSGSASSGGSQTSGAVGAGIGRPLTETEDELLAAVEAAGRGAMIGAAVAGPPGAVAGALVGAASESAKVGSEVWYLWGENAARQKKLDAQLVVIKRDIKLRQDLRTGLDNLIAKSMTLEAGSKEYENNILTMNTIKDQIRKSGGVVDEDEIPDRLAKTDTNRFGPKLMSSGGTVYASQGSHINYQPRGTDTVPAMLTPGEFVINRASTQKHLPVLKAINSGTYSRGDIVQHLSNGGMTISSPNYLATAGKVGGDTGTGGFDFSGFMRDLTGQIAASFSSVMEEFSKRIQDTKSTSTNGVSNNKSSSSDGISNFLSKLDNIAKVLAGLQIPSDIRITGKHDVNVIINGDKALSALSPSLQALVTGEINKKIAEIAGANPELKTNFNIP